MRIVLDEPPVDLLMNSCKEKTMRWDRLRLRPATMADLSFLSRLRHETMREHIENSGLVYDNVAQKQRIDDRFDVAQIIRLGTRKIGLLKIDRENKPWRLFQIQLVPAFQRQGLGSQLIRQVLAGAAEEGAAVELCVLKANPARRLYERLGFSVKEEKEKNLIMVLTPFRACLPGRLG